MAKFPPDDSPTNANRRASPPKWWMYVFTHRTAAKQSCKQKKGKFFANWRIGSITPLDMHSKSTPPPTLSLSASSLLDAIETVVKVHNDQSFDHVDNKRVKYEY